MNFTWLQIGPKNLEDFSLVRQHLNYDSLNSDYSYRVGRSDGT